MKKAQTQLQRAIGLCDDLQGESAPAKYSLRLEILSELAEHQETPASRRDFWSKAINGTYASLSRNSDSHLALHLLFKVVDYTQDSHAFLSDREIVAALAKGRELADRQASKTTGEELGRILTAKAALLRRMSRFQSTRQREIELCEQAIRCAEKADALSQGAWYSSLALAECIWFSAQFESTDEKFNNLLKRAESYFQHSVDHTLNRSNILALTRFYRSTYQAMPFVAAYQAYERIEHNKSDYLKGSFMWAEGALQLWYAKYPDEVVLPILRSADQLLETAIDSGYGDARHIVSLAFVKAAQGDTNTGTEVVKLLHPIDRDIPWTELANRIKDSAAQEKTLDAGLAMGITKHSIWNKLGTYARRFLADDELAEALYRTALQLNPASAVALTNLALTLARTGEPGRLSEAERLISKAASCADRRFRWWRTVREYILQARATNDVSGAEAELDEKPKLRKLADLLRVYDQLSSSTNKQRRGYELERIVARLVYLTLGNVKPSYRIQRKWSDNSISQIDAAFCLFDTQYFRVESKWHSEPTGPADIVQFRDKLDVVGLVGLFISVSGFAPEAISKAASYRGEREIILMDGDELRMTLVGTPSFDEAIRRKRQHLLISSNPYHKLVATTQDEVELPQLGDA